MTIQKKYILPIGILLAIAVVVCILYIPFWKIACFTSVSFGLFCWFYTFPIKVTLPKRKKNVLVDFETLFLIDLNKLQICDEEGIKETFRNFSKRFNKDWGLPHIFPSSEITNKVTITTFVVSTKVFDKKGETSKWKKVGTNPWTLEPKWKNPLLKK